METDNDAQDSSCNTLRTSYSLTSPRHHSPSSTYRSTGIRPPSNSARMPRNSKAFNKNTPNMAAYKTTPKKDTTSKTSFVDLPAEIRNDIYTLALTSQTLSFPPADPKNRYGRAPPPSLPLSNKQIHHECLSMFYSNTTFHFPSPDPLLRLLRKIGAKKRLLVKEIIVDETAPSAGGPSLGLQAHEMLRVLERRLRDAGVRLPVEVYKVRMRRSRLWAGGEIEEVEEEGVFARSERVERVFGKLVPVHRMEVVELDR